MLEGDYVKMDVERRLRNDEYWNETMLLYVKMDVEIRLHNNGC
jgi:hypothetical protein